MRPLARIVGIICLSLLLIALCVLYGASHTYDQPSKDAIAAEPSAFDGETIFLFGTVERVDVERNRFNLRSDSLVLEVTGGDPGTIAELESGSAIQVAGKLTDESSTMSADDVVVDYRTDRDRLWVYGLSIVGGLVSTLIFLLHWSISWRGLRFVPRGGG